MAETFNEQLLDAMISHQIGLLNFSGGVRNEIWELLDASEADLAAVIKAGAARAGFDSSGALAARDRLLRDLRETRLPALNAATSTWIERMQQLAQREPEFFDTILSTVSGVQLGAALPTPAELRSLVTTQPFEGRVLRDWASNIKAADVDRIERAVQIGLVQGEHPNRIARRVVGTVSLKGKDGVTQITRNQAAALVRTAVSSVTSSVRDAYMEANEDVIPFKMFTATLDARTTAICRSLDGNVYETDDPKAPVLPLHFGERSIYSPILDGEVVGDRPRRDFTQRGLLREYARDNGLGTITSRDALPYGHKGAFDTWARARMRDLTGTTAAKTTYQEWLSKKSLRFQQDILGNAKGKLFNQGGLTLDKFVAVDGRELTLEELASRHSEAFIRAGLDPLAFGQ